MVTRRREAGRRLKSRRARQVSPRPMAPPQGIYTLQTTSGRLSSPPEKPPRGSPSYGLISIYPDKSPADPGPKKGAGELHIPAGKRHKLKTPFPRPAGEHGRGCVPLFPALVERCRELDAEGRGLRGGRGFGEEEVRGRWGPGPDCWGLGVLGGRGCGPRTLCACRLVCANLVGLAYGLCVIYAPCTCAARAWDGRLHTYRSRNALAHASFVAVPFAESAHAHSCLHLRKPR